MRSLLTQRPLHHRTPASRLVSIFLGAFFVLICCWHFLSATPSTVGRTNSVASISGRSKVGSILRESQHHHSRTAAATSLRLETVSLTRTTDQPGSCVGGQESDHFVYYNPTTGDSHVEPKISPSFLNASVPQELRHLQLRMVAGDLLGRRRAAAASFSPVHWRRPVVGHHVCEESNVVLSYAVHYKTFLLRELVMSFQQHASFCDFLVLVVDTPHERLASTAPWLSSNVVLIRREDYVVDDRYKGQPSTERIGIFRIWLEEEGIHFRYVLIIDARDTLFYGDPFAPFYQWNVDGLLATGELFEYRSEVLNQVSMKELLPSDPVTPFLSSLRIVGSTPLVSSRSLPRSKKGLPVLNSGLFGGTIAAVLDYVHNANYSLHEIGDPGTIIDQVLYMVLVTLMLPHMGFPHTVVVSSSSHGPYRHMIPQKGALAVTSQLSPVNCAGVPYLIQHQTDRCSLFDESRNKLASTDAALYRLYEHGLLKSGVSRRNRRGHVDEGSRLTRVGAEVRGGSERRKPRSACLKKGAVVVLVHVADSRNVSVDEAVVLERWAAMFQRTFSSLCDELVLVLMSATRLVGLQPSAAVDMDYLPTGPQIRIVALGSSSSEGFEANAFDSASPLMKLLLPTSSGGYDCLAIVLDGHDTNVLLLRNVFASFPSCTGTATSVVAVFPQPAHVVPSPPKWFGWTLNGVAMSLVIGQAEQAAKLLSLVFRGQPGVEDDAALSGMVFVCPDGDACFEAARSRSQATSKLFWNAFQPDRRADGTSQHRLGAGQDARSVLGRSGTFVVRCLVCVSTHDDADYSSDGDHERCDASFRVRMVNSTLA